MKHINVFLSHNSEDKQIIEDLAIRLQTEDIRPWLDKWNLIPGEPFQESIEKALEECSACVVFFGRSGIGPWQNEEMRAAINRRVLQGKGNFRVIPVLLPNAKLSQSHLPTFLSHATWVEFKKNVNEPEVFHRLVCGIKGIAPGPSIHSNELERPYKFLDYFETSDLYVFWGRDEEINEVVRIIKIRPFLVLYGVSGIGKTSLVLAGIVPNLHNKNYYCVHARCEDDPLMSIKREVIRNLPPMRTYLGEHLPEFFATMTDYQNNPVVVILDQFEEFFLRLIHTERQAFMDMLACWRKFDPPPFKLVFVIREDYLGRMDELKDYLPDPLKFRYRLSSLNRQNARLAIAKPVEKAGLSYEEGMIDRLLDDLEAQNKTEEGIFPPHLQIVCSRLVDCIQPNSNIITWRDVQKQGELTGILNKYIEQVLSTLPRNQQNRAWDILKKATTAAGTKTILGIEDISDSEGSQKLVQKLVERRLMRKNTKDGEDTYELAHDKLAETLEQRMSETEKLARDLIEMVRIGFLNYQKHGISLDVEKINLLKKHSDNPHPPLCL